MNKTSDVYGPIFNKICEIQNAPQNEQQDLLKQLFEMNYNAYNQFRSIDDEYNAIRNSQSEMEEKIKALCNLLDEKMDQTAPVNMQFSKLACEDIYRGFWNKLDSISQKYLIMADYLHRVLTDEDADFSPLVLEYGRAVENELVEKIFYGFADSLVGHTEGMIDSGKQYGDLKKAIANHLKEGKSYIFPAKKMVDYLGNLSDESIENDYNEALKKYLIDNNIDKTPISSDEFTSMTDELFGKYRNKAAHQGQTMEKSEAGKCKEKSKKVLKRFMSAIP